MLFEVGKDWICKVLLDDKRLRFEEVMGEKVFKMRLIFILKVFVKYGYDVNVI